MGTWKPFFSPQILMAPYFALRKVLIYIYSHNTVYFLSFKDNTYPLYKLGNFKSIKKKITIPKLN